MTSSLSRTALSVLITSLASGCLIQERLDPSDRHPSSSEETAQDPAHSTVTTLPDLYFSGLEDTPIPLEFPQTMGPVLGLVDFEILTPPSSGHLEGVNPNRTYVPATNWHGSDEFLFTLMDTLGDTQVGRVLIDILPVNDPPHVADRTEFVSEDGELHVHLLSGTVDGDGDTLRVTALSTAELATVSFSEDGPLIYLPHPDVYGTEILSFEVSDSSGSRVSASLRVEILPIDDAPIAEADQAFTEEDIAVVIDVLANDNDVDGHELRVTSASGAAHGSTQVLQDGRIRYEPSLNFFGQDSFIYTLQDESGLGTEGEVQVTVSPVNDAPTLSAHSAIVDWAETVSILLQATDVDGDSLTFSVLGAPLFGSLGPVSSSGLNSAEITYSSEDIGVDLLRVHVDDGLGGTATAPLTIDALGLTLTVSGAGNSFNTDTGQMNGTAVPAWTGTALRVEDFILQAGAELVVEGSQPFFVDAERSILIAGALDAAGSSPLSTIYAAASGGPVVGQPGPGGYAGGAAGGNGMSQSGNDEGGDGAGPGAGQGGAFLSYVSGCSGGGGGGAELDGSPGSAAAYGTSGEGGISYDLVGAMVGGSGGGGGSVSGTPHIGLNSGAAGGGGGGAVLLHSAGSLTVSATGLVDTAGGAGGASLEGAGGGGGAGGLIELLVGGTSTLLGTLLVDGGSGGVSGSGCPGGDGGDGLVALSHLP